MSSTRRIQATALAALRERPYRFGELRALLDVSDSHAFNMLSRLMKRGLVERPEPGLYRATGNGGTDATR